MAGCAGTGNGPMAGRVVVIGAGYAGATAAKYMRLWSPDIEVTLVERNGEFISCPLSNLVLGGSKTLADITVSYDGLDKYGVKRVRDDAVAVDPVKREVRLASGATLDYDRLIVAPGIDFQYDTLPGLNNADAQSKVLHAWKAGAQTVALRKQLEAMKDGGVYALHIPKAPYRCPPGPYERACQVAHYFKTAKPKSKVLILDANEDVVSKKGLFMAAWNGPYKGIVEYRPNSELEDVDVKTLTAKLQFSDVQRGRAERGAAASRGQYRAGGRPHHREQPLVRRELADDGIGQGAGRACAGGCDVVGATDAEVGAHGEPARQGVRGCGDCADQERAGQSAAADDQHLLQFRRRQERGTRRVGARV